MDACSQAEIKLRLTILDENGGNTYLETYALERDISPLIRKEENLLGGRSLWALDSRLEAQSSGGWDCGG